MLSALSYFSADAGINSGIAVYCSPAEVNPNFDPSLKSSFALKDSMVNESYRIVVIASVNSDRQGNILPIPTELENFYSWSITLLNSNGRSFKHIALREKRNENIVRNYSDINMVGTIDSIYDKQIRNIELWLNKYKNDFMDYACEYLQCNYSVVQPNAIFTITLLVYEIIPATYGKDHITWEDLIDKETWKNYE